MISSLMIAVAIFACLVKQSYAQYTTILAGNGVVGLTGDNGPATSASVNNGYGCFVDSNSDTFFADNGAYVIRKVNTAGIITTIGGNGRLGISNTGGSFTSVLLHSPTGVVGDSNYLYISDSYHIWKYNRTTGIVDIMAGNGTQGIAGDGGPASSAEINKASGIWLTTDGTLFLTESGNHLVRKITTANIISTVVGGGGQGIAGDGGPAVSTNVQMHTPQGVYMDTNGVLFVADRGNGRIRNVVNGIVNTYAGGGPIANTADGFAATNTKFAAPYDVKGDSLGNIFVVDGTKLRVVDYNTKVVGSYVSTGLIGPRGLWLGIGTTGTACVGMRAYVKTAPLYVNPSMVPTAIPTINPTGASPTFTPSTLPTTETPTETPTTVTDSPSSIPSTASPSSALTLFPTVNPTVVSSTIPSTIPTSNWSTGPTASPTATPMRAPTQIPTAVPVAVPVAVPSTIPSTLPTTTGPTPSLTNAATCIPTVTPTVVPSTIPSTNLTAGPTDSPTVSPTSAPTFTPTTNPTATPSIIPSRFPSTAPSRLPTAIPTKVPTRVPTAIPTNVPTFIPTVIPTATPSTIPTVDPTFIPTTLPTPAPSHFPTSVPSVTPSSLPTSSPSSVPSTAPTSVPTAPTFMPTAAPSFSPTAVNPDVVKVDATTRVKFVDGTSLNDVSLATLITAFQNISDNPQSTTVISTTLVSQSSSSINIKNKNMKARSLLVVQGSFTYDIRFRNTYVMALHPGYNSSQLASLKVARIQQQIELGSFETTLRNLAVTNNATQLLNSTCNEVTEIGAVVVPPSLGSSSSSGGYSTGVVVGIVLGVVFGLLILSCVVYLGLKNRRAQDTKISNSDRVRPDGVTHHYQHVLEL